MLWHCWQAGHLTCTNWVLVCWWWFRKDQDVTVATYSCCSEIHNDLGIWLKKLLDQWCDPFIHFYFLHTTRTWCLSVWMNIVWLTHIGLKSHIIISSTNVSIAQTTVDCLHSWQFCPATANAFAVYLSWWHIFPVLNDSRCCDNVRCCECKPSLVFTCICAYSW